MSTLPPFPWASEFTEATWSRFTALVEAALAEHHVPFAWTPARDALTLLPEGGAATPMGLANLAQLVLRAPGPEDWEELVRRHVSTCLRFMQRGPAMAADGLDIAIDQLKVRLYPASSPHLDRLLTAPSPIPGTVLVLVRDLPEAVLSVPREQAATWGLGTAALFELALQSTLAEPVEEAPLPLGEGRNRRAARGPAARLWHGHGNFVATHALDLQRALPAGASALVAAPNRHLVLFYRFTGPEALDALLPMWSLAQQAHADGPGPVTPDLFWWHDGRFTPIQIELRGAQLHITPPAAMQRALAGLPPARSSAPEA